MQQNNQKQFEENLDSINKTLKNILTPPLASFIQRKLQQNSSDWRRQLRGRLYDHNFNGNEPKWNDPQVLLKIISYFWNYYFKVENQFDRVERSIVNELIDVRNNCSHNEAHKFSFEYTWRALHSMEHLLNAINKTNEAEEIKQQREALTKRNYEILSESVKKNVEAEINWQHVSRTMLETQKFNQLTSNSLTAIDGVALEREKVYVPLGLVERKHRKQSSIDEGSPERGSELYQEKLIPIENEKFFEQIRHKTKPIAIIGEPGAGKTTLLQKIADWILKEDTESTPIWISLSEIGTKSLTDYLLEDWLKNATQKITIPSQWQEAFVKLLESGKVWLLLDGVDEMAVDNPLQNIASQLNQGWINNVRVVLTCRLNIWDANKNALYNFDVYRNLDFNPEQIDGFISNWFQNINPQKGKDLRSLLKQPGKERIDDLIKNPLRLMLLCYSWQRQDYLQQGKLPSTKAGLYEWFAESFYTWNQGKVDEKFSKTELDRALGKLAVQAIDSKESRFRLRETFIRQSLEESLFEIAQNLGWLNQVGVAAENPNEKVYAFYHPSFEEYFAAKAIDDWRFFLNPISANPTQGTYRIFEPQWKEVILLWLGRENISFEQKEEFIKTLVKLGDECEELYGEQAYLSAQAYFLAAAATNEFRGYSSKEEIIEKVVKLGFGYFDSKTTTWKTFPYYVETSAKQALKEADKSDVSEVLLSCIEKKVHQAILPAKQKFEILCNFLWCLNEFDPQDTYLIDTIANLIDRVLVWSETTESDSEYGIHGESIWITEWLPFSRIKVRNPKIIKAIIDFLKDSYEGKIKQRKYEIEKNKRSPMPTLDEMPLTVEDEFGNTILNEERIEIAAENAVITDETDPLKQEIGLTNKLERAAAAFDAAGDALARIAVGNRAAVKLLIDLLKKEASNNFKSDLYLKIVDWLSIISPQNQKAIQLLLAKLQYSQDRIFYYKVAKAILKFDNKNKKALQALSEIELNKIQDSENKLEIALGLIEINSNRNDAIDILFQVVQATNLDSEDIIRIAGKHNKVRKILIALIAVASQNHGVFKKLIELIKSNCHLDIQNIIIYETSKINDPSWKLSDIYLDLLNRNIDNTVKLQIALHLIKVGSDDSDIYQKTIELFTNNKRERVYYDAALEIVKINPNESSAIEFLINWATPEEDIQELYFLEIDSDIEEIIKVFVQYNLTIEPVLQILQTYKNKISSITDIDKHKLVMLLELLKGITDKSNNPKVITILTNFLETTEDSQVRCQIAKALGKIAPNNFTAISTLIEFLNGDKQNNISKSTIISGLSEIGVGNQVVVNALLESIINNDGKVDYDFAVDISLQKVIQGNQFSQTVNVLKNCQSSKSLEKLLWYCAQNMSYLEFYQAWHHSEVTLHPEMAEFTGVGVNPSTLSLKLENISQQLSIAISNDADLKANIKIICINFSKIIDRDNPAVEIYDQMLGYSCSERANGEPKTMPSLKSYCHSLQRSSDKLMVFVFYDSTALEPNWTGFSQNFLNALNTFEGAICVITEQPAANLKQFLPNEPHLVENMLGWIKNLYLES